MLPQTVVLQPFDDLFSTKFRLKASKITMASLANKRWALLCKGKFQKLNYYQTQTHKT